MDSERLALLPQMIVFAVIAAAIVAKLEIQIEGKDGWAKNLPVWKIHNKITRFLLGDQPLTGYHFWMVITLLWFLQSPFFVGVAWSLWLELQIIAIFWFAVLVEDFLWFVFNPEFGIKSFRPGMIKWHTHWVLGVPRIYFGYLIITATLITLSLYV